METRNEPLEPAVAHLRPAPGFRLATAVSYTISPLILPPLVTALVLAHFGAPAREVAVVTGLVLVFLGLVPLAYLIWMVRSRQAVSLEVRNRAMRTRPFLVSLASTVGGLVAVGLAVRTAAPLVLAVLACTAVNTGVLALITLRWKISVHAASVGSFVAVLAFVALRAWPGLAAGAGLLHPAAVLPLLALVPLVAWARVRTGAHTVAQVSAGSLFGLTVPFAELLVLLTGGLLDAG